MKHENNIEDNRMQGLYHNHLGSGTMITNSAGAVEHTLHYTAFGETLLDNAINYQTPYQFAGYERDGESGLNYAEARYYRKDIFISTDPMWAKYPSLTSYNYCGNNPIKFIDPDGNKIFVTGSDADEYTSQLSTGSGLTITRDVQTGQLSASGEATTSDAQRILESINSIDVISNITADNTMKTIDDKLVVGGAFGGNTIETQTTNINMGFEDAAGEKILEISKDIAVAKQYVNPQVLGNLDKASGNNGQASMHEALEAYEGGLISLEKGVPSPPAGEKGSVYKKAHSRAPSQGNIPTIECWDAKGNKLNTTVGASKVEVKSNGEIIMTYP